MVELLSTMTRLIVVAQTPVVIDEARDSLVVERSTRLWLVRMEKMEMTSDFHVDNILLLFSRAK